MEDHTYFWKKHYLPITKTPLFSFSVPSLNLLLGVEPTLVTPVAISIKARPVLCSYRGLTAYTG